MLLYENVCWIMLVTNKEEFIKEVAQIFGQDIRREDHRYTNPTRKQLFQVDLLQIFRFYLFGKCSNQQTVV